MPGDDDLKDTNVGAVGSDEDKALRKSAAQTEPAWANAGQKSGVEVWRIEAFKVVAVDTSTYGQFHRGDSYIVLQTVGGDDGKLIHTIFYYLGTETSIDEKGTAAYKTVELDDFFDGQPKQVREVMEQESGDFKALFDSLTYLDGGVESGFRKVSADTESYDAKLWQVRKVKGKTTSFQVPLEKKMINSHDSFVLDSKQAIYIYNGEQASPFEKAAANKLAEEIEAKRASGVKATQDIDDGFWALLP